MRKRKDSFPHLPLPQCPICNCTGHLVSIGSSHWAYCRTDCVRWFVAFGFLPPDPCQTAAQRKQLLAWLEQFPEVL
jgi:hypothetical protein